MNRLANDRLSALPADVKRPGYDRAAVRTGVLHFGPGAFHRAHQAAAFERVLEDDPRWGITGVSLHSRSVADALNPQNGLYTLALLDAQVQFGIVGSVGRILTHEMPEAILGGFAHADTRIVSSTVTEKGYCLSADGTLDFAHPAIGVDVESAHDGDDWLPRSFTGWLVKGLQARRTAGLSGVTVLSCDNLTGNGDKLQAATLALAQAIDPETARWIADEVRFPNAMVDSITPATDDVLRGRVADTIGLEDAWPIQRERFTQWVIEDSFIGERPPLDLAGVTFTRDVRPFETAKLRLLNGAHSALAYIGLGRGQETVAQAMADPPLARFVERLMREDIAPSVPPPPGMDLDVYVRDVLARFANPAIRHLLSQIAWDGSQKLPYRLLDTIRDALAAGRPIDRLAFPIAAWLRFLERAAREGRPLTDPMARVLMHRASDWRQVVALRPVFGTLHDNPAFLRSLEAARNALEVGSLEPVPQMS